MDILDIDTTKTLLSPANKFLLLLYENKNIEINLFNVYLPFGCEKFNDKLILNIELEDNNNNNNIISKMISLEENIKNGNIFIPFQTKNLLKTKGFTPNIKKSKLGYIIRSHILKNTEIFLKTKNNGKLDIDYINLVNTTCNIKGLIKGCWFNDNSYGLYITLNSVEIVKM